MQTFIPPFCGFSVLGGDLTGGGVAGDEIDPRDLDRPHLTIRAHLECHRECSGETLSDADPDQYLIRTWMSPTSVGPMESRHP